MTADHALRWECPDCGVQLLAMALSLSAAEDALLDVVREHLDQLHAGAPACPVAAASWLHGSGHRVELWGGPHDGEYVWCPPGPLPPVIGVHRTAEGALVPIRSVTARLLPHVDTYVLGIDGTGTTAADRYVWTPQ